MRDPRHRDDPTDRAPAGPFARAWRALTRDVMSRADRAAWHTPTTLPELGETTARWLEGTVLSQTSYAPRIGPDDPHLVPVLAAANRAGYVTDSSQAGVPLSPGYDGAMWDQRAGVEGWCDDATMLRLRLAARTAGLHVGVTRPRAGRNYDHGTAVVVSRRDGHPTCEFGSTPPRGALGDLRFGDVNDTMLCVLRSSWYVTVVDLEWGRDDRLWAMLETFAADRPWDGPPPIWAGLAQNAAGR